MNDAVNVKAALRREMRNRLRAQSAEEKARASEKIILNGREFLRNSAPNLKRAAIFLATEREPNLDVIGHDLQQQGVLLYAPHSQNSAQPFALIADDWSNVSPNARGWREPQEYSGGESEIREPREASEMDLIFVPALAFDETGARLGQGGGWYDRALAGLPVHIPTSGIAFDFQIVECVPREAHDHSVSVIITDKRIITRCVNETA